MKRCTTCSEMKTLDHFGRTAKCKACRAAYARAKYAENPEHVKRMVRRYRDSNPEKARERTKKWRDRNREHVLAQKKKWRQENVDRMKELEAEWRRNNPEKRALRARERRGVARQATPAWLTADHQAEMRRFYTLAKEFKLLTGDNYHVDHIVPLRGRRVCGLHVPWNLQVLPSDINMKKGNRS